MINYLILWIHNDSEVNLSAYLYNRGHQSISGLYKISKGLQNYDMMEEAFIGEPILFL